MRRWLASAEVDDDSSYNRTRRQPKIHLWWTVWPQSSNFYFYLLLYYIILTRLQEGLEWEQKQERECMGKEK